MTDTVHLGMPFIEGSQAQKHVTHNEALRILDAVVQIGVLDADRTAPPPTPAEGDRHIVASGATGAWAGHADAVAVREDGTWRFLAPKPGWCAWSEADGALLVYDGTAWTDVAGAGTMSGSVTQLGINDTASDPNLLTVRSNAALFGAVTVADGGTGDMRLQISKEASAKTASVVFSDAFSGRAEFGLIGSDAFKLKVSNDGTTFVEALTIDQSSGNTAFPRGVLLTGVISPSQITSNQNDYNPAGIGSASVLNLSSDTLRSVSGLAGGAEGRVVALINTGSQIISLLNENALSTAANRFSFGSDMTVCGKQAVLLRYDGTASRWHAIATTGLMGSVQPRGFTNLLANGSGRVNMRVRSSNANNTFGHDRWYALTQTAAIAVSTVSNVADGVPSMMRLTQSQATAQRMGYAQVIVSADCRHLRGQQVTLSGKARLSAAHSIRYAIIEWTGTADAPVRDVVNAWTNGTYTGGNFFKSTSNTISGVGAISPGANTLADLTPLTVTLGSAFNNLIVLAWTESAEAQNVTLDLRLQLEPGGVASSFEVRPVTVEERLCEPFYQKSFPRGTTPANANRQANSAATCWQANTLASARIGFATKMFKTPAMTMFSPSPGSPSNGQWSALIGGSWVTGSSTGNSPDDAGFAVGLTATGAAAGSAYIIAGDWEAEAEAGI